MTKPESNETQVSGATAPFSVVGPFGEPVVKTIAQAGEAYAKAWLEWQEELVDFTSTRLREGLGFRQSLVGRQTLSDVFKLQQDWAIAAVRAYLDEAGKLTEIAGRVVRSGASSLSETMSSSVAHGSAPGSGAAMRPGIAAE